LVQVSSKEALLEEFECTKIRNSLGFYESASLLVEITKDTLGFARACSVFLLSPARSSNNGYCWGADYMMALYDMCPAVVRREIIIQNQAHAILIQDTVAILKNFEVQG
jgi:hypothetical protein